MPCALDGRSDGDAKPFNGMRVSLLFAAYDSLVLTTGLEIYWVIKFRSEAVSLNIKLGQIAKLSFTLYLQSTSVLYPCRSQIKSPRMHIDTKEDH